ncbi:MAG TPA: histidinol-phosphate transaminase [Polyangiaceae bacterium]|jgi:histidinol-phosphate aminotransferase
MTPLVTPNIESLIPYEGGKPIEELERELGVVGAIKLASNENPLGPSPKALAALQSNLQSVHRYPDSHAYRLRTQLSQTHAVPIDQIIQGAGSAELIDLLIRTFTTAEHHIVFAEPSFVVYKLAALAHGTPFTLVPLRDQTHDLEAMAAAVTDKTRLLFVANPNNPTSTYVGRAAMERLLRTVPSQVTVVADEAYIDYADADDFPDCLSLRSLRERLVVLRTFSKVHGLASLRVGYAIGPSMLIDYLNRVRSPFNVSSLGQLAACAALEDREHVERSRKMNRIERARLSRGLGELGVKVLPSQANFLFVDLGRPAQPVFQALLNRGVIVRAFPQLQNNLRITVGTPTENDRLLATLAEVLA